MKQSAERLPIIVISGQIVGNAIEISSVAVQSFIGTGFPAPTFTHTSLLMSLMWALWYSAAEDQLEPLVELFIKMFEKVAAINAANSEHDFGWESMGPIVSKRDMQDYTTVLATVSPALQEPIDYAAHARWCWKVVCASLKQALTHFPCPSDLVIAVCELFLTISGEVVRSIECPDDGIDENDADGDAHDQDPVEDVLEGDQGDVLPDDDVEEIEEVEDYAAPDTDVPDDDIEEIEESDEDGEEDPKGMSDEDPIDIANDA